MKSKLQIMLMTITVTFLPSLVKFAPITAEKD